MTKYQKFKVKLNNFKKKRENLTFPSLLTGISVINLSVKLPLNKKTDINIALTSR